MREFLVFVIGELRSSTKFVHNINCRLFSIILDPILHLSAMDTMNSSQNTQTYGFRSPSFVVWYSSSYRLLISALIVSTLGKRSTARHIIKLAPTINSLIYELQTRSIPHITTKVLSPLFLFSNKRLLVDCASSPQHRTRFLCIIFAKQRLSPQQQQQPVNYIQSHSITTENASSQWITISPTNSKCIIHS